MLALIFVYLAQLFGTGTAVYPHPIPSTNGVFMGTYAYPWPKPTPVATQFPKGYKLVIQEGQIESIEATTGHRFASQLHYYTMKGLNFGALLTDAAVQGDLKYGRMPWFSETCNDTLVNIANGLDDKYFANNAKALQSLAVPVGYRFFWEFNLCLNNGSSDGSGACANSDNSKCFTFGATDAQRGAEFIAAWEHIHTVFLANGATNVAFVWCPSAPLEELQNANLNLTNYLPPTITPGGMRQPWVDWIGFDVYDKIIVGFQSLIAPFYSGTGVTDPTHTPGGVGFSSLGLPMMLDETGENNSTSTLPTSMGNGDCAGTSEVCNQTNYFGDIGTNVPSTYPLLHAITYFSSCPTCIAPYSPGGSNPPAAPFYWSLDTGGLAALATLQGESPFNARGY